MLVKRGDIWHSRIMFQGKLYQRTLRTKSKLEATKYEAIFRSELVKQEFGIIDKSNAPTLEQFTPRLLAYLRNNVVDESFTMYESSRGVNCSKVGALLLSMM